MAKHYQYGVICLADQPCNGGKPLELTEAEYSAQLFKPDCLWECPGCGEAAEWDDDSFATNPPDDEPFSNGPDTAF